MGADDLWYPTMRKPPLAFAPQLIDEINVDLTPFKLSFGMQAIVCHVPSGSSQTDGHPHKKE